MIHFKPRPPHGSNRKVKSGLVGVNQDCWLLVYSWQLVVCRHVKCWSVGLKSEKGINFYFFTFVKTKIQTWFIFLYYINHLSIHYSITPILQVLWTSSFDRERMTTVYQQLWSKPGNDQSLNQFWLYPAGDGPQFVHILGPAAAGMPPATSWDAPTENEDINFFTSPWQSGHFTWALWVATIRSNL